MARPTYTAIDEETLGVGAEADESVWDVLRSNANSCRIAVTSLSFPQSLELESLNFREGEPTDPEGNIARAVVQQGTPSGTFDTLVSPGGNKARFIMYVPDVVAYTGLQRKLYVEIMGRHRNPTAAGVEFRLYDETSTTGGSAIASTSDEFEYVDLELDLDVAWVNTHRWIAVQGRRTGTGGRPEATTNSNDPQVWDLRDDGGGYLGGRWYDPGTLPMADNQPGDSPHGGCVMAIGNARIEY